VSVKDLIGWQLYNDSFCEDTGVGDVNMGSLTKGDGFGDMRDLLGGFDQSSMTSQGLTYQEQQVDFQNCQFSAPTNAISPGKIIYVDTPGQLGRAIQGGTAGNSIFVGSSKPRSISCPDCDKIRNWSFDLDGFGNCSCGRKEGSLTNVGWLESRIAEVVG